MAISMLPAPGTPYTPCPALSPPMISTATRNRIYSYYFILHIVITLAIDSCIALPASFQFEWQQKLAAFHIRQNNDLLFAAKPVWLQAFVWVELLLQTPFFVWAALDLRTNNPRVFPAVLAYGVEAAVTTYACLAEVVFLDMNLGEKANLFLVYLPTFVIPVVLAIDFYQRLVPKAKLE